MTKLKSISGSDNPLDSRIAIFISCLLSSFYLAGMVWPGYVVWGISQWSVVGSGIGLPVLAASLLLLLMLLNPRVSAGLDQIISLITKSGARIPSVLFYGIITAILIWAFFTFRLKALVYGDGFLILSALSDGDLLDIYGKGYLQILWMVTIRLAITLGRDILYLSAEQSLAWINILGGVAAWWGLFHLSRLLGEDTNRANFIFWGTICSGATLLFFGYIENYTWALAFSLWALFYLLRAIQRNSGWAKPVIFALLAFFWHAITVPILILVGIAYTLAHPGFDRAKRILKSPYTLLASSGALLVAISLIQLSGLLEGEGIPHVFVPVWSTTTNPYWFLSTAHMIDFLNVLLFAAPVGILSLLVMLISRRTASWDDSPVSTILRWYCFLTVTITFWIDPELGAPRDWDLLSLCGFPLSLFALYTISKKASITKSISKSTVPFVLIFCLFVVPNIYEKRNPETAVNRLDTILWESPHYQTGYDDARRGISWGTTLNSQLGRPDLAAKYFRRVLSVRNNSSSAWFNLGQVHYQAGQFDSSEFCYRQALKLDVSNGTYYPKLARALQAQNRMEAALQILEAGEEYCKSFPLFYTTQGILYWNVQKGEQAAQSFRMACRLAPDGSDENYNLGALFFAYAEDDSASVYFARALQADPGSANILQQLTASLLALGKEPEAVEVFRRYRRFHPDLNSFEELKNKISRER